jgi:hypothetical protein
MFFIIIQWLEVTIKYLNVVGVNLEFGRFLASPKPLAETMRIIADRFDSAKSSIHNSVMNITRTLAGLKSDYIHWPFDEYREAALSFQTKSRFPGSISIRQKKIK